MNFTNYSVRVSEFRQQAAVQAYITAQRKHSQKQQNAKPVKQQKTTMPFNADIPTAQAKKSGIIALHRA